VMSTVEYTSPGERLARSSLVALIQVQVARIAALPLGVDASVELAELERLQDELYGD
jgi:hypothetical protein